MKFPSLLAFSLVGALGVFNSRASAQTDAIYWTAPTISGLNSSILTADLNGSNSQPIIPGLSHPRGMAIDSWAGHIYWADSGNQINMANRNGTGSAVIATTSASSCLAFDDVGRKLYWTDKGTTSPEIVCSDPDGSNVVSLVTSGLITPVPIAVDGMHGKMYWSDHGTNNLTWANLNGSNVLDIVVGLSGPSHGIAVDPVSGKLFWGEGVANGVIHSANLDGSNAFPILTGIQGLTCLAVDRVHQKLYWTISSTSFACSVWNANYDGTNPQPIYPAPAGWQTWGIAIESGSTPMQYCTAKVNSLGCLPQIGFDGFPSAYGPNGFMVTATNVLNNKSGMLLWSGAPASTPFHGGTLCLAAPIFRTQLQNSYGSLGVDDCSGSYSFLFSQSYMASHFLTPGTSVCAQYWSRDPGYLIPDNIGLTDALRFVIAP